MIKLLKKYKQNIENLNLIAGLFTETAIINIPVEIMKEFIGELKESYISPNESKDYISVILDCLLQMIRNTAPKEIFSFNGGPRSGIGVVSRKTLPKEGYGFFGWIRFERKIKQNQSAEATQMQIFQLAAAKDKEIEFSIKDNYLFYSVSDGKAKDSPHKILFTEKKLEEDNWYFIELYHINTESPKSIVRIMI